MVMWRVSGVAMLLLASLATVEGIREDPKTSWEAPGSLDPQENQLQNDASALVESSSNHELYASAEDKGPHSALTWIAAVVTLAMLPDVAAGQVAADGLSASNAMTHPYHYLSRYGDYVTVVKNEQNPVTGNKEYDRLKVDETGEVIPREPEKEGAKKVIVEDKGPAKRVYIALEHRHWTLNDLREVETRARAQQRETRFVVVELAAMNVQDIHLRETKFVDFVENWKNSKLILDLNSNGLESEMINKLLKAVQKNPEAIQEIDLRKNHPNAYLLKENQALAKEINKLAGYRKVIMNKDDRKVANKQAEQRLAEGIEQSKR